MDDSGRLERILAPAATLGTSVAAVVDPCIGLVAEVCFG